MRSTEILVLTTNIDFAKDVFGKICNEIIDDSKDVIFGFLPIDDQIQIQLYGFEWKEQSENYFWERIFQKALGVVVLFDWSDSKSFSSMKNILHHFEANYSLPIVTASKLNGEYEKLPFKLYRGGLPITGESRFTFYSSNSVESIRELIVGLININLELMAKD
jgi:hypothetical protein